MIQPKSKQVLIVDTSVTVSELTVEGLASVLPVVDELLSTLTGEVSDSQVMQFISKNWDKGVQLLSECTSLGEDVGKSGASALVVLVPAWWEVNKDFFGGMTQVKKLMAGVGNAGNAKKKKKG